MPAWMLKEQENETNQRNNSVNNSPYEADIQEGQFQDDDRRSSSRDRKKTRLAKHKIIIIMAPKNFIFKLDFLFDSIVVILGPQSIHEEIVHVHVTK